MLVFRILDPDFAVPAAIELWIWKWLGWNPGEQRRDLKRECNEPIKFQKIRNHAMRA